MSSSILIGASLSHMGKGCLESCLDDYVALSRDLLLNSVEIKFEREKDRPSIWPWEVNDALINVTTKFTSTGIHLPYLYLNPIAANPRIARESIDQLKQSICKAAKLKAGYVVLHAHGYCSGSTMEEQIISWRGVLSELTECAEDNFIYLAVENCDLLHDLAQLVEMIKSLDSKWLGITLDIGHAHIRRVATISSTNYPIKDLMLRTCDLFLPLNLTTRNMPFEKYTSLEKFIESNVHYIKAVHIHDYDGKNDHLSLGQGKINFSFLKTLKKLFQGPYIFESDINNDYQIFKQSYRRFLELCEI